MIFVSLSLIFYLFGEMREKKLYRNKCPLPQMDMLHGRAMKQMSIFVCKNSFNGRENYRLFNLAM